MRKMIASALIALAIAGGFLTFKGAEESKSFGDSLALCPDECCETASETPPCCKPTELCCE